MVPGIRDNLPYDPSKSFAHIGRVAAMHGVFSARNGLPVRTLAEMISYAKANPGKLNYGSGGVGAPAHLIFELVKMSANIDITHVPYKGDADVMRDLVGEGVDLGLVALSVGSPFAIEGKVKPLAVTGAQRARGLPGTQALGETNIKALEGIDVFVSFGLVAPQATPPAIVHKLTDAVNRVSQMPEVVQRLDQLYMAPLPASPAEFQQHIATEVIRWRNVNKRLKLTF
jgi:tripartite-type tricarboxylate transporter receptor subunit TctC